MAGDAWTAELFRDSRGRHPVLDFLEKVSPKDREATLNRIRFVLELAKHQPVYTLGRPQIDTLEGPIKELRATDQIRILFSWEMETMTMLLLEADLKKNGKVSEGILRRARNNLAEWKVLRSSDTFGGL